MNRERLQSKGHALIEQLEARGISQNEAYRHLAKALHLPPQLAHFSQMYTPKLLHRAISELEKLLQN